MLHELLMGMLGFAGDILVEDPSADTFHVKPGFDLLTPSERDQINKLAPLGWYYKKCSEYSESNDIQWGSASSVQAYKAAMCLGLNDFLDEYTSTIAALEAKVVAEGPLPLSYLVQHFQQYSISLPVVWGICKEVEARELRGCQILDFLAFYRSGVPVVKAILERLLLRVRVVFLKQSMSWMLYGELSDANHEYFIQYHPATAKSSRAKGGSKTHAQLSFDWGTSYTLRLSLIPESHLSPRLASKVAFAGKAVKLLSFSYSSIARSAYGDEAADDTLLEYISGVHVRHKSPIGADDAPVSTRSPDLASAHFVDSTISSHLRSNGFSPADVERFIAHYQAVLAHPAQAVEYLELLVNDVSTTVSTKLWALLRDVHGFAQFSYFIRNTFLMGKGELFQSIIDGVLQCSMEGVLGVQEIDLLLRNSILKAAAERHNLDDESLSNMLQLRVNSSVLNIADFSGENIVFAGTAALLEGNTSNAAYLCTAPHVDIASAFENLWTTILKRQDRAASAPAAKASSTALLGVTPTAPIYTTGAVWLPDVKFVNKGFTLSAAFSLEWSAVTANLSPAHAWLPKDKPGTASLIARKVLKGAQTLTLGALCCVVHCDRLGPRVLGAGDLGIDIFKSVAVGVSFHAICIKEGKSEAVKYLARIFVSANSSPVADENVIGESLIDVTFGDAAAAAGRRSVKGSDAFVLDVEYSRELAAVGTMTLVLRVRLREAVSKSTAPLPWDVEVPFDVSSVVKLQGGHAFLGLAGSSVVLDSHAAAFTVNIIPSYATTGGVAPSSKAQQTLSRDTVTMAAGSNADKIAKSLTFGVFPIKIASLSYLGKSSLMTYPVASTFVTTRHPDTYVRIEAIVNQLRAWITLKLQVKIPSIFSIIVDEESTAGYDRLFSFIMKVRLIGHSLESLWRTPAFATSKRQLCLSRQCMHFFIGNLLYFLQEDVVDAEFTIFLNILETISDYQSVLKAHRNFVSNIVRLSMIDNIVVQEGFERVFQVCLRFVAVSRIINELLDPAIVSATTTGTPKKAVKTKVLVVPPEELEAIQKEFVTQISQLFQILRKIETKGFIFRLDFNGFLSSLAPTKSEA